MFNYLCIFYSGPTVEQPRILWNFHCNLIKK